MVKYVCMHCEYTWDSETGDETYKVPAGPMMTGYALNVLQVLKELSLKTNKF